MGGFFIGDDGELILIFEFRDDDYLEVFVVFISDIIVFGLVGLVGGYCYCFLVFYVLNIDSVEDEGNMLQLVFEVDYWKYFLLICCLLFVFRFYGMVWDGDVLNFVFFGGFDMVCGFDFFELVGDCVFYSNFELCFLLIDFFVMFVFIFQGIQGCFFFDVVGVWFDEFQDFEFYDLDNDCL